MISTFSIFIVLFFHSSFSHSTYTHTHIHTHTHTHTHTHVHSYSKVEEWSDDVTPAQFDWLLTGTNGELLLPLTVFAVVRSWKKQTD